MTVDSHTDVAPSAVLALSDQRVLDLIVAAIGIALGVTVIALVPSQIPGQSLAALRDMSSSAFMPILSSLLLVACSAILLARNLALLRNRGPALPVGERADPASAADPRRATGDASHARALMRAKPFALAIVIFGAYLVLTTTVGMLIATATMMVALSLAYDYRRLLPTLVSVVVTPIVIYILFERLLLVMLPRGAWF